MAAGNSGTTPSPAEKKTGAHLIEKDLPSEIMKHSKNPMNFGTIQEPDSEATLVGSDLDSVSVQLHLSGVVIDDISFQTTGGGFARACASVATELVRNKPLSHALTMTGSKIVSKLGGLPTEHNHCAELAAETIKVAAEKAIKLLSEPQRRMYLG